ncbi:hypothetical protein [Acidisoma cellulosilyticum]|nr:hypothetical protein [Acidisoma cellulosilyticum]
MSQETDAEKLAEKPELAYMVLPHVADDDDGDEIEWHLLTGGLAR